MRFDAFKLEGGREESAVLWKVTSLIRNLNPARNELDAHALAILALKLAEGILVEMVHGCVI